MASWRDVRRIALALPGASESTSRDHSAWLVNDKFFVWERPLRKSDLKALGPDAPAGPIVGVRTADLEMKEALLGRDRAVYFTTPHFDGYPAVLVQLTNIKVKDLREVIVEAWLSRAPERLTTAFLRQRRPGTPAPHGRSKLSTRKNGKRQATR